MFSRHSIKDTMSHSKNCSDLKWNCTGSYLALASSEKSIKIGQLEQQGNTVKSFQTVTTLSPVNILAWHPSEKNTLALTGEGRNVELWDVKGNCSINKISTIGNNINMAWSPNGNYIALGNKSDNVAILDVRMNRQLKKMKFSYEINELEWSFNSDHVLAATGGLDMGAVDILSVSTNGDSADIKPLSSIGAHTSNCYCLKIDKNFQRMAIGSADFLVSLWTLDDMICYNTISCLDSPIRSLSFNSDGNYIAVAAESNIFVICDTDSGELTTAIDCKSPLSTLSWHPEHDIIAIALEDTYDDSPRYRSSDRKQYIQLVSFDAKK